MTDLRVNLSLFLSRSVLIMERNYGIFTGLLHGLFSGQVTIRVSRLSPTFSEENRHARDHIVNFQYNIVNDKDPRRVNRGDSVQAVRLGLRPFLRDEHCVLVAFSGHSPDFVARVRAIKRRKSFTNRHVIRHRFLPFRNTRGRQSSHLLSPTANGGGPHLLFHPLGSRFECQGRWWSRFLYACRFKIVLPSYNPWCRGVCVFDWSLQRPPISVADAPLFFRSNGNHVDRSGAKCACFVSFLISDRNWIGRRELNCKSWVGFSRRSSFTYGYARFRSHFT